MSARSDRAIETISLSQVTTLWVVSRLTLTVVFFSAPLDIKQDVWWESFPAALLVLPVAWVLDRWLLRPFGDKHLCEISRAVLGKWPAILLGLLCASFFLFQFSVTLRFTAEFFKFAFLTATPIIVVILVIAGLAVWAAKAGLEVMGRASQVVFPILTGSIILIFIMLLKDVRAQYLLPLEILNTGPVAHVRDIFNVSTRTIELLWLCMAYPAIQEKRGLFRAVVRAQLWIGLLWVLVGVVIFGILGRHVERYYFPFFIAARTVSIADFLERIDAVFPAFWVFGMFLRAGLQLWVASVSVAHALGLKDYRPLATGLAGIGVTYAVVQASSFVELQADLAPEILTPFTFTFAWLIPLLLTIASAVARKRLPQ